MPTRPLVFTRTRRSVKPLFDLIRPASGSDILYASDHICVESGVRTSAVNHTQPEPSNRLLWTMGMVSSNKQRLLNPWNRWIKVQGLSPISDAVLGVKPWSDHTAINQMNLLLTTDRRKSKKTWQMINSHRRLLVAFAREAIARFLSGQHTAN
ncbi:hypothetical protein BJX65DRAFT_313655 [Aspergillus insuetus]